MAAGHLRLVLLQTLQMVTTFYASGTEQLFDHADGAACNVCPAVLFTEAHLPFEMTALPSLFDCRYADWQPGTSELNVTLHKLPPLHTALGSGADMAAGHLRLVLLQTLQMVTTFYASGTEQLFDHADGAAWDVCPAVLFTEAHLPFEMTALPWLFDCRYADWQPGTSELNVTLHKLPPLHTALGSGADMAAGHLRLVLLQTLQMVTTFYASGTEQLFDHADGAACNVCPAVLFTEAHLPFEMTALPSLFDCRYADWQPGTSELNVTLHKLPPLHTALGSGADMAAGHLRLVLLQTLQMVTTFYASGTEQLFDHADGAACNVCPAVLFTEAHLPFEMTALPWLFDCRYADWQPGTSELNVARHKLPPLHTASGSGADMAAGHLRLVLLQTLQMVTTFYASGTEQLFDHADGAACNV
ncbi:hypothetical protein MTO96_024370 [Rhipicephalus appendiculatus]